MTRKAPGHRISWTGHTINPGIFGCTLAGPMCRACYAAATAHRGLGPYKRYKGLITKLVEGVGPTWTGEVFTEIELVRPRFAALPRTGRHLAFLTSMADIFHKDVPVDFLIAVHAEIVWHWWVTFQTLTKRPERMAQLYTDPVFVRRVREAAEDTTGRRVPRGAQRPAWTWPLPNIWPGTSMGDDTVLRHDRLRALCRVPTAALRFLSVEPMLSAPNLRGYLEHQPLTRLTEGSRLRGRLWAPPTMELGHPVGLVILGGEAKYTRAEARPLDLDGVRAIIDHVNTLGPGVQVQVKQLGTAWAKANGAKSKHATDPSEWPEDLRAYYGMPERWARLAGLEAA